MTLGPRVVKTGLSITLALYICQLLGLEPGLIAAIAAIFTLQPTIYKSWRHVLDQLQTNTLGAIVAIIAIQLFGNDAIAIGLASVLVILICLKMNMESSIGLTLVTVIAIMSAPLDEDLWFAINRFLLVLVGIASAFAVNIAVFRPKHDRMFLEKVRVVFDHISLLLRTVISDEMTERAYRERKKMLDNELERLDALFNMFDEERRKLGRLRRIDIRRFVVYKHMRETLHKGADILQIIEEHYYQGGATADMHRVFARHLEQLIKMHENILLGYEGKIKDGVLRGAEILERSSAFMGDVMAFYNEAKDRRLGLVLVGSAIYEYGFQLHRLERMVVREAGKARNKDKKAGMARA